MKLIDIPEPTPTIRQLVFQEKTTLPKLTYQKNLSPSQLKMALHQCEQYAIFQRHTKKNINKEICEIEVLRCKYDQDLYKWAKKAKKYPVAVKIWDYLKTEMNLSDVAAAGIMGNIMVEAGGQSLKINQYDHTGPYYGICQWYKGYFKKVQNKDLDFQLDFLKSTIKSEFKSSPVSYKKFLNSTSVREASSLFARGYEKCARPRGRQNTAIKAYKYFVEE